MLSGLDGLQRTDPVLHLFPVLGTEDEPAERSDHLEGERVSETDTEAKKKEKCFRCFPPQPPAPLRKDRVVRSVFKGGEG